MKSDFEMKGAILLSPLLLPLFVAGQEIKCPCFKDGDLERFTGDNLIQTQSCSDSTDIGIFHFGAQRKIIMAEVTTPESEIDPIGNINHLSHHDDVYGFAVHLREGHDGLRPTCLTEGDVTMDVTMEEAKVCSALIRNRCSEIGHPSHERI